MQVFEEQLGAEMAALLRLDPTREGKELEREALRLGARRAIVAGRYEEALPWTERLILLAPDDALSHALLREAQAFAAPTDAVRKAAVAHLVEGLNRWPFSVHIARAMMTVALAEQRIGAAAESLQRLEGLAPGEPLLEDAAHEINQMPLPKKAGFERSAMWPVLALIVAMSIFMWTREVTIVATAPELVQLAGVAPAPDLLECRSVDVDDGAAVCVMTQAAFSQHPGPERSKRMGATLAVVMKERAVTSLVVRDADTGEVIATKLP